MVEIARKICKRLHAYLRMDRYSGTVYSVYPNAVHLKTSIGMLSVLTNARCLHPFSVVINSTKQLERFAIEEGQEVLLGDERIEIPACGFSVDLSQATDFDLSVESMQTLFLPTDLDIRTRHLLRVIETNSRQDDLGPLVTEARSDPYCDEIRALLPALHAAFREQNPDACRDAAAAIGGIGAGLTPAADDLLCGYAAAYAALSIALGRSEQRVLSLTRGMASGAAAHTTELSAAALLQCGEGLVSEDVYQLLRALFSDVPYAAMVAAAAKLASGEGTGGVNLLSGVYLALLHQYGRRDD